MVGVGGNADKYMINFSRPTYIALENKRTQTALVYPADN